jgi:hypothetical protein
MRTWNRLGLAAVVLSLFVGALRSARADDPPKADEDAGRGFVGYGASFIESLNADQKREHGITREHGLFIESVSLGGPAFLAGGKAGDVILSVNGKAVPDTSAVDVKDEKAREAYMNGAWKTITHAVKPGDEVVIEVERQGDKQTIRAKAVTKAVLEELVKDAQEEAQSVKVPDPSKAGPSNAAGFSFEGLAEGVDLPSDLLMVTGFWSVVEEEEKKGNHGVLQQSLDTEHALAVVTGDGRAFADGTVSVRLSPRKGMTSVGGGLAVRVKDRLHYYVAVVDGVSRTLRIARLAKKETKTLASVDVPSPKLKSWHTLEVTTAGQKITATLDGTTKVEATDAQYVHGWPGLYTENDAETLFDDLKVTPK